MDNNINYINGQWLESSESLVSINDAGFLLGDGLFETIRFHGETIFKLENHVQRLQKGLENIRINLPLSSEEIEDILLTTIDKNLLKEGLLRLMVTRGILEGAPWNFAGPPGIYVSIRPLSSKPQPPVKVVFYSESKYPIIRFNPAIKSLNYLGNMLAKHDAEKEGAFEPVFYNQKNLITECAIRNIFFIKGDTLFTPHTDLGVLPGVMRDTIIKIAASIHLNIEETHIYRDTLKDMDEAFISSTGIGLLPCYWQGWESDYTTTNRINQLLDAEINAQ
ncbi:MAG: aminotransferase class IV [Candidatus Marinimicrobia bacterium]|jgi:branched-subunit amino acid aminotransferase/4-amino-4-deoxychorismate lyase|nr:aminotransferase class IV [Candidatus Neomarinimicrobiota bacterium]MDP6937050.1 aminotransferase class IV [Candidatus Neomarinimicrobiota bacterium]